MATRLYYTTQSGVDGGVPISPAVDAIWEGSPTAERRMLLTRPFGATAAGTAIAGNGTNPNDAMKQQFFSLPLMGAQTIAGTVKGQIMANEAGNTVNAFSQMVIRVFDSGASLRGTLMAGHTNAISSEWNTSARNIKMPLAALSPVSLTSTGCQDGDRIVIEIGARIASTLTTNNSFRYVATAGLADLPENETATTDGYPWVEFSQDLSFYPPAKYSTLPQYIAH